MPNRILREALLDSDPVAAAGELAEVLFCRLLLVADDLGRFDGRVTVISRRCWPLGGPGEEAVAERLGSLVRNGVIVRYEVEGKPFIVIPKFKQRTRQTTSKFPAPPPECMPDDSQPSDVWQTGDLHPRTEAEAEAYSETEGVKRPTALAAIPLLDGSEFQVTDADVTKWAPVYPAVDVLQAVLRMREWCLSNPTRRKTRRGVRGFVTTWLGRDQDKGGSRKVVPIKPKDEFSGAV